MSSSSKRRYTLALFCQYQIYTRYYTLPTDKEEIPAFPPAIGGFTEHIMSTFIILLLCPPGEQVASEGIPSEFLETSFRTKKIIKQKNSFFPPE
jgi:hypothetical protein